MNEQKDPKDMSEAEYADWLYEHRDELEDDDSDEVHFEATKPLAIQYAFRLTQQEATAVREAAADAGVSVSDFIRQGCRLRIAQQRGGLAKALAPHLASMAHANDEISRQVRALTDQLGLPRAS